LVNIIYFIKFLIAYLGLLYGKVDA